MVRLSVAIETPASSDFVRNWWLDYGEGDAHLSGDIVARTALWVDKTHAELRTTSRFAGRTVQNDGDVFVEAATRWRYEGTVRLHDEPFARLRTQFGLEDLGDRRRLTASFELAGLTWGARLILPVVRRLIRVGLLREYDEFRRAIDAAWLRDHEPPGPPHQRWSSGSSGGGGEAGAGGRPGGGDVPTAPGG